MELALKGNDPLLLDSMSYSENGWAGDLSTSKPQSNRQIEADGCPMTSFPRRQSCVETSSGMTEYYAMCSTAEKLLHLRAMLEHFWIPRERDSFV